MTIASEITKLNTNLTNSYTACQNKGATMPANQNFDNLATCINSIQTGGSPTLQTKSVSLTNKNGQTFSADNGYDGLSQITVTPNNQARTVTPTKQQQSLTVNSGYSGNGTITVNAVTSAIDQNISAENIKSGVTILGVTGTYEGSGGGGTKYGLSMDSLLGDVNANGVLQAPSVDGDLVFTGVEDVGTSALEYRFYKNSKIKSASFPDLTELNARNAMQYTFCYCSGLMSIDLSSLTIINGSNALYYAFQYSSLASIDLSSLTTVNGVSILSYAFQYCTSLTSVDLSSLTTVSGNYALYCAFQYCTSLTSIDLSSLTTVNNSNSMQSTFSNCTNLASVDLSGLTTIGEDSSRNNFAQFSSCFNSCNNLTSISFSNLEKIYCTGGTSTSYGTFANNNKVQKMYFPKLDTITYGSGASSSNQNACKNIFYGCSALTELHFGVANQSAIEASPGYSTAWGRGAGNVTIYFDL